MSTTIISGREYGKQASSSKPFEAIHDTLMCSQNEISLVIFKESFYPIRTELNDVTGTIGISYKVWLNSQFAITICRVTPKNVDHKLLLNRCDLVNDLKWPFDLLNLV